LTTLRVDILSSDRIICEQIMLRARYVGEQCDGETNTAIGSRINLTSPVGNITMASLSQLYFADLL
jgi:hypothetical protein